MSIYNKPSYNFEMSFVPPSLNLYVNTSKLYVNTLKLLVACIVLLSSCSIAGTGAVLNKSVTVIPDIPEISQWTLANAKLPPRFGHSSVVLNDEIFVIGGAFRNDIVFNDVWKSSDGSVWTQVLSHADESDSTQFSPRFGHSSVVLNDEIFVIAGSDGTNNTNDVWKSSDGSVWTQVLSHTDKPSSTQFSARAGHSSVVLETNKIKDIFVMSGYPNGTSYSIGDVWKSGDAGRTWKKIHQAINEGGFGNRSLHSSAVLNNDIYTISGRISAGRIYDSVVRSSDGGLTWEITKVDKVNFKRYRHSSVVLNNNGTKEVFMIAGTQASYFNDVWKSDDGSTWKKVAITAPFPARAGHSSVVLNDEIFVIAGYSSAGKARKTDLVWKSSNAGAAWTQVTTPLSARKNHSTVVKDDSVFIIGGNDGTNSTNDVWKSNNVGKSWTEILANNTDVSTTQFSARNNHSAVLHNDNVYVIAGELADGTSASDVWKSNDGITWSELTVTKPFTARASHSSVVLSDNGTSKIFVIAGHDGTSYLNDVWSSSDGSEWTVLEPTVNSAKFSKRRDHSSVIVDGFIYVIGGYDGTDYLNDVWKSDDAKSWEEVTITRSFSVRTDHSAVVINNTIYVIGGSDGTNDLNNIWYAKDGTTWTQLVREVQFPARKEHSSVVIGDTILVIAGSTADKTLDDVWSLHIKE